MPRPRKLPHDLKRNRIDIWFDDADFEWIDEMAKIKRTDRSHIVRAAVANLIRSDEKTFKRDMETSMNKLAG